MKSVNLKRLSLHAVTTAAFVALIGLLCSPMAAAPGDADGSFTVATNLMALTRLAVEKDSDNVIVITVYIDRIKDKDSGLTQQIPGGIGSYSATVSGDSNIQIIGVRGVAPYSNPTFDPGSGIFSLSGLTGLAQPSTTPVAKIVVRLTGSCLDSCSIGVSFQQIISASQPTLNVPEESINSLPFMRGDTNGVGGVNIVDAMFIAQYTVGLRTLADINGVNAASVKYDTSGDIINIVDAMFIAQYTLMIRDSSFN